MSDVKEEWMKLDEEEAHNTGPPKKWEKVFKAMVKPECGGLFVLECKQCKAHISPGNPYQAAQRHKCKEAAQGGERGHLKAQPAAFMLDPLNFAQQ
eukprot:1161986-Pelagomonas_calceolata.AAC.16